MKYNRVLLKLSGESLMGAQSYGIDPAMLTQYAQDIKAVVELLRCRQLLQTLP